jgi:hypothetical protein
VFKNGTNSLQSKLRTVSADTALTYVEKLPDPGVIMEGDCDLGSVPDEYHSGNAYYVLEDFNTLPELAELCKKWWGESYGGNHTPLPSYHKESNFKPSPVDELFARIKHGYDDHFFWMVYDINQHTHIHSEINLSESEAYADLQMVFPGVSVLSSEEWVEKMREYVAQHDAYISSYFWYNGYYMDLSNVKLHGK